VTTATKRGYGAGMGSACRLLFLRKFLTHGTRIASITPSSRWMSRELASAVSPERPQRVLELGAGTGVVTRAILDRLHPASTLVAFEPDTELSEAADAVIDASPHRARARVVRKMIQDASDADFATPTTGSNMPSRAIPAHAAPFDVVVSGLPVPSFTPDAQAALFAMLAERAPAASYAQLTEIPLVYKPLYAKRFEQVRFVWVPRNLPPGGVYHCGGLRAVG
jgi:phospholipid N-methyltransferase